MATANNVNIRFAADTNPFVKEVRKGREEAKALGNDAKKTGASIKDAFGRSSGFTQGLKALQGGGALLGLGLATRELEHFSTKFSELKDKMAKGASKGEIAAELLTSIPIVGSLAKSIDNIRSELDGSADALRKIKSETAAVDASTDFALKKYERMRDTTSGLLGILRKVKDETDLIGKSSYEQAQLKLQTGQRDELEAARKAHEEGRKKIQDDTKGDREIIDSEYDAKLKALRDAKEEYDNSKGRMFQGRENRARAALIAAQSEFDSIAATRSKLGGVQDELNQKDKQYEEAKNAIAKKYGLTREQLEKETYAGIAEVQRDANNRRLAAEQSFQERLRDIAGERRDLMLREGGLGDQADFEQIGRDARKQQDDLRKAASDKIGGFKSFADQVRTKGSNADPKELEQLRQNAKEQERIEYQTNAQIGEIERLRWEKELAFKRKQHLEIKALDEEANKERLAERKAFGEELEQLDFDFRQKQLVHDGKAQQAQREAIDHETMLKQRAALDKGLSGFTLGGIASGNAATRFLEQAKIIGALQRDHDQQLQLKDDTGPHGLAAAVERRNDFTIVGVEDPQVSLTKQQLAAQKTANDVAKDVKKAVEKIAQAAVVIRGI